MNIPRRDAAIVNTLCVPSGPETDAILQRVEEALSPPRDLGGRTSFTPPRRAVSVTAPIALLELADLLAKAEGMTPEVFLSALLGEQLFDMWKAARIIHYQQSKQQRRNAAMSDTPRPDNDGRPVLRSLGEGGSPGEGPERAPDGTYNKSGIVQQEQAGKAAGNPAERQAEAERISRDNARHQGGFPVAGHGEPEPENDPGRERTR